MRKPHNYLVIMSLSGSSTSQTLTSVYESIKQDLDPSVSLFMCFPTGIRQTLSSSLLAEIKPNSTKPPPSASYTGVIYRNITGDWVSLVLRGKSSVSELWAFDLNQAFYSHFSFCSVTHVALILFPSKVA